VLWIYAKRGVYRFCEEEIWDEVFSACAARGWEAPSETETMWLESPLTQYKRGSFFTAEDAASFAEALNDYLVCFKDDLSLETSNLLTKLTVLLVTGPIFIWSGAPQTTGDTGRLEVLYVYLCPECGFMHHGNWFFEMDEAGLEKIERSVTAMLRYKYCPLCSSTRILSEAFILPRPDPAGITDLATVTLV
jgi:hypothetical protein